MPRTARGDRGMRGARCVISVIRMDTEHDAGSMQFTHRELLRPRLIGLTLTTTCVMVGVFNVTGPIGTYDTLSPDGGGCR